MKLVVSYRPPPGDPAGAPVAGRAWTYDSAVTAAALAAQGDVDASGVLLDQLQALQRRDGALALSYDIETGHGAGSPRSGGLAWAGLACMVIYTISQWRSFLWGDAPALPGQTIKGWRGANGAVGSSGGYRSGIGERRRRGCVGEKNHDNCSKRS